MDILVKIMIVPLLALSAFAMVYAAVDPNCTVAKGNLKHVGCQANMKVNWWNIGPYVYSSSESQINGTFKEIIENTIRKCCGECVQFTYLIPSANSELLKSRIGSNGSVVNFPVYGTMLTERFQNYPYFPVIESPGVIYIEEIVVSGSSANAVLDAVFMGWPVLVLTLVLAALSGIVMWALDTYWNPEEFPHSFFQGAWEGFWWAFVSMTTVGYGDKAPKSFIARVFAFFWILTGLVIISIFTATVTTALTALSLTNDVDLFGKTVSALNHSEEYKYGVGANAKMVPFSNINGFVDSITKNPPEGETKSQGGLIDSYVAGFEKDKLSEARGVKVSKIFDHQFAYGFVITNELHETPIAKCIRRQLSTDESWIVDKIQRTMKALPEPKISAAEEKSSNMFDASSTVFQTAIFMCLGISLFLILCGVAWEYLYWKPKLARDGEKANEAERVIMPYSSYEELVSNQCQELDDVMISEVSEFYKVFNNKMEEIRKLHVRNVPVDLKEKEKLSSDYELKASFN